MRAPARRRPRATALEGAGVIDLVGGLGEGYAFDDIESDVVEVGGINVRVARARMLYTMKRGAGRPQDHADAQALRERFDLEE